MNEPEKNQEGVEGEGLLLSLNIPDTDLISEINRMIEDSESLFEKMKKIAEGNVNYWKGEQIDIEKLRRGSVPVVDNRLFLSGETIIPIMTSRTPEPTIRLKNPQLREKLKQILMNLWEVPTDDDASVGMQANFEMISRHWMLYRVGVLKYFYDPEIDDVRTVTVRADKVKFDRLGTTVNDCRFVAEYCDDTLEMMVKKWPDKKNELLVAAGRDKPDNTKLTYVEYWTNDYYVYKFQNVILEKKRNPNFDYGDMNETGQPVFNIFKKSRKPYLTLSVFNLGKTVYDDTSLFEQGKTLQDNVNKLKRNISDNAADNGVLAGSGDLIEKKVLEAYTGAPDEKLFVRSGDVRQALMRLEPKQMPQYVFNDLQDNKAEIDNIFGSHDTTRGERGSQKTLGEAQLLKQADMGRIDLFSRALDRLAQDWYTAMFQMLLVFKTQPVELNSNDEEGTTIIFDRNEFVNPETGKLSKTIIKVKPGSAMSIDKDVRRAEAIQLAQTNLIDPITFYERLDYSNPQEMAQKLFLWLNNPIALFPELQAEQQQQQEEMVANTPIPEGVPISLPTGLAGAPEGVNQTQYA